MRIIFLTRALVLNTAGNYLLSKHKIVCLSLFAVLSLAKTEML